MSDVSQVGDAWDVWDASGRIWQRCPSAEGRAVAGSNPASPIISIPLGASLRPSPILGEGG